MQQEHTFTQYFDTRFTVFKMYLQNTSQNFEEEDLHQLRVEIKKMRSLFELLKTIFGDSFDSKYFKKTLRKLFKPGGKLRETQLNILQADETGLALLNSYRNDLLKKNEKQILKLRNVLGKFIDQELGPFESEIKHFIKINEYSQLKSSIVKFVSSEIQKVEELFPHIANHDQLHRMRRYLKSSGYALKLYQELWYDVNLVSFYDEIKTTESLIGDWHDKIVFRQSILNFANKHPEKLNETDLEIVKQKLDSILVQLERIIPEHLVLVFDKNPY